MLEAGHHVLFADLDAIFLKPVAPLLARGDIIGERIWGRPSFVRKKWGAGICTGFYYLRSSAATVAIFRRTHELIAHKRRRQPKWQASDQWAINHAVDDEKVVWASGRRMADMSNFTAKYYDYAPHVGRTSRTRVTFVVLPHAHVPRSCPILKVGLGRSVASP